jgi:hypothetical protein
MNYASKCRLPVPEGIGDVRYSPPTIRTIRICSCITYGKSTRRGLRQAALCYAPSPSPRVRKDESKVHNTYRDIAFIFSHLSYDISTILYVESDKPESERQNPDIRYRGIMLRSHNIHSASSLLVLVTVKVLCHGIEIGVWQFCVLL